MPTRKIYFDESGFTGYNLLDPNQPFFSIASSSIEPGVAENLLRSAFPNYKGEEFKFTNIAGSRNQSGLSTLFSGLEPYSDQIFLYTVDKQFALFAKMVDFLVEPAITQTGYDFYADGFCRKYTNYIYVGLTLISEKNIFPDLISAYSTFSRSPSVDTLKTLTWTLKEFYSIVELEIKPFIDEMIVGSQNLVNNFDLETFRSTNDIHLTTMLAILGYWRKNKSEDFIVIHDSSSHFLRQKEMWDVITNSKVPPQLHPVGEGDHIPFPLRVIETIPKDSKDCFGIQLCDILAGFTSLVFRERSQGITDSAIQKIATETGYTHIYYNGIMLTNDFPEFPPKRLTGLDAIDLMGNIIRGK
jgi:hypothetical protein